MKRILDAYQIPEESRQTFRRDRVTSIGRGAILAGLRVAEVVAKKILCAWDIGIAGLQCSLHLGCLLSFVSMRFCARSRRQDVVFLLYVLAALPLLAIALPVTWVAFVCIVGWMIALASMVYPLVVSVYQTNYPAHARGKLFALNRWIATIVGIILAAAFGWLLDRWPGSFHGIYPGIALLMLAGAFAFRGIRAVGREPTIEALGLRTALRQFAGILRDDRNFRNFMICQFTSGFANIAAMPLYVIYLTDPERGLDVSALQATVILAVLPSAGMLLSTLLWGAIFDKINILRMRVFVNAFFCMRLVAFSLFSDLWLLAVGFLGTGIGMGGSQLVWSLGAIDFAEPERAPMYTSLHTFLTGCRGVIAPFVGVWLSQQIGIVPAMRIFATVYILASFMFLVIVRPPGRRQAAG